jgi:transcription termination factor NusB
VSRPRLSTRHRSREAALQVLYAVDLDRQQAAETSETARAEEAFERVAAHFELPDPQRELAHRPDGRGRSERAADRRLRDSPYRHTRGDRHR